MPTTKRGPAATHEDLASKRGGRATTRRSSGSRERAPATNEDDPVLRDALCLSPSLPDSTANFPVVGNAGNDDDGHWLTDLEPEEHRRPRVTEPSKPLQTGNEEVDFGVARPQEERLGFSPIRDTARSRTGSAPLGFTSRNALMALEVVDLMEERHRTRDNEKRLHARLPRLEGSQTAERACTPDKLHELAINQMIITVATSYRRFAATKFPGLWPTYERLVDAMVQSLSPGKPEGYLLKQIRTLEAKKMEVWRNREQLYRMVLPDPC